METNNMIADEHLMEAVNSQAQSLHTANNKHNETHTLHKSSTCDVSLTEGG